MNPLTSPQQSLLLTLEEISRLVSHSGNASETLSNIVQLLQQRFETDVCSVYLLEPDRSTLVLAATIGLRPESVGRVRMRLDEGLAGLVAETLQPQVVADATRHPRFKYFREAGEDPYHSFLGVPLIDRGLLQGVLVLQTIEPRVFGDDVARLLMTAGTQLAPVVSEARTLGQFQAPAHRKLSELASNLWWSWDAEATASSGTSTRVWAAVAHNPIALLEAAARGQARGARRRARPARTHQPHLPPHAGVPGVDAHVGRASRRRPLGASRRVLLRRVRPARVAADLLGRPRHPRGRSHQGGVRSRHPARSASASTTTRATSGSASTPTAGSTRSTSTSNSRLLPMQPAMGPDGTPVTVTHRHALGTIAARVWKVTVGRNTLLLLDSDVEGNRPRIASSRHGCTAATTASASARSCCSASAACARWRRSASSPGVVHLNEGHSAFAALELVRQRMVREGIDADEAMQPRLAAGGVHDAHAGARRARSLPRRHRSRSTSGRCATRSAWPRSRSWARPRQPGDASETFCMTVLALKLSHRANAVSSLHGQVSRAMWRSLYPGVAEERVPIGHITNGVHAPTWLAPAMHLVFDRHLGPDWPTRAGEPSTWDAIETLDDGELWETHQTLKTSLIAFARRRAVTAAERRGDSPDAIEHLQSALSLDALTIGFARRFATYKRANLILRDIERLASLVNDAQRPIQLLFAGKAHPLDGPGKEILQEISRLMRDPRFAGKLLFVEDYDIAVGRFLVQGVDVWLNTPRRPLEASGTSGQKVVLNGGLNLSVLDGWWAEAYDGLNGFGIGQGETHTSVDVHDRRDAEALAAVLSEQVIPLFYDRDRDGLPRGWIARMKRAIRTLGWRFSAQRMVADYVLKTYVPAAGGTSSQM